MTAPTQLPADRELEQVAWRLDPTRSSVEFQATTLSGLAPSRAGSNATRGGSTSRRIRRWSSRSTPRAWTPATPSATSTCARRTSSRSMHSPMCASCPIAGRRRRPAVRVRRAQGAGRSVPLQIVATLERDGDERHRRGAHRRPARAGYDPQPAADAPPPGEAVRARPARPRRAVDGGQAEVAAKRPDGETPGWWRRCAPAAQGGESRSAAAVRARSPRRRPRRRWSRAPRPRGGGRPRVIRRRGGATGRSRTTTPSRPVQAAGASRCRGPVRRDCSTRERPRVIVHAAPVVGELHLLRGARRAQHLARGVEQRPELLVAIAGLSDGLAIDSKRHVVGNRRPLTWATSIRRSSPSVNAASAPMTSCLTTPTSSAGSRGGFPPGRRRTAGRGRGRSPRRWRASRRHRPSPERRRRAPRRSRGELRKVALRGEDQRLDAERRGAQQQHVPPRRCPSEG